MLKGLHLKKLFKILVFCLLLCVPIAIAATLEAGHETVVLKASVSVDKVPHGFFGTWKVTSTQQSSTNPFINTGESVDYWNLSRVGDVLILSNPVSAARAQVTLQSVRGNTIKFEKISKSVDETAYETPVLKLQGENFTGSDTVVIEKYKYGKLIKTDKIEFKIRGEKVSGSTLKELLNIKG